jgi:hypothetical protein
VDNLLSKVVGELKGKPFTMLLLVCLLFLYYDLSKQVSAELTAHGGRIWSLEESDTRQDTLLLMQPPLARLEVYQSDVEMLEAWRILRIEEGRPSPAMTSAVLAGRKVEMQRLHRVIDALEQHRKEQINSREAEGAVELWLR